ncbi:MAG: primosomal protein N', partial [Erysipelotrichaceae bacterium]
LMCPHCDVALSFHKQENQLKCHICDYTMNSEVRCQKCGGKTFAQFGYGTQKVQEVIEAMFPNAKTLRMDRDTTRNKNGHQIILDQFENHQADILIGTQMIAKGLDYPNVTLVGILNSDSGLNRLDFRSQEDVFSLIMQSAGRSGRSDKKGDVFLQVYNPEHFVIQSVMKQDYYAFFQQEMKYRHNGQYPPYTYLASIYIQHIHLDKVITSLKFVSEALMECPFKRLGPTNLTRLKGIHRYRILLKTKDLQAMIDYLNQLVVQYDMNKCQAGIKIEINPHYVE